RPSAPRPSSRRRHRPYPGAPPIAAFRSATPRREQRFATDRSVRRPWDRGPPVSPIEAMPRRVLGSWGAQPPRRPGSRCRTGGAVAWARGCRGDLERPRGFSADYGEAGAGGEHLGPQTLCGLDVGVEPPPVLGADHEERFDGELGGPFQDALDEARITRRGID